MYHCYQQCTTYIICFFLWDLLIICDQNQRTCITILITFIQFILLYVSMVYMKSNQNVYFYKDTITRNIQKNGLTAIHVIKKRSMDIQLWIIVSSGWYSTHFLIINIKWYNFASCTDNGILNLNMILQLSLPLCCMYCLVFYKEIVSRGIQCNCFQIRIIVSVIIYFIVINSSD